MAATSDIGEDRVLWPARWKGPRPQRLRLQGGSSTQKLSPGFKAQSSEPEPSLRHLVAVLLRAKLR